ncbi:ankyrin repeat-containing domain protein [Mycena galopus ATCC 62051]|nr:ankyrin repeat-containing domain protein [Mycena galopus ATCC 62051]
MSGEGNESKTFNYNISGGHGGTGGTGHGNGGTGGSGGTGEGPTVIFDHSTNKMYADEVSPVPFLKSFLNNNSVHLGQGLEEVLCKWLEFPPDTKDRQYELQSLHHETTGGWLLHDPRFVRWKDMPGSLWIKGSSGTGKSVLSSTVIEEIVRTCPNRSAAAYFYFDFRNERQRMDIMLRSIVWQLSGQSPLPYSSLCRLYRTLGNGTIQPQHRHVQQVLENLLTELERTYIIIDGLDECRKTDWKHLNKFIHRLCLPAQNTLHLLFTSQPLGEFQAAFKDVTFIGLGSGFSNDDIRSFVDSEVPRVITWAIGDNHVKDVTEQIMQKSDGMFRMAKCLLAELGGCHWRQNWEDTLKVLPADLCEIYSRFITQAKHSIPVSFMQAIFRWLVFSAREVTPDELADAIAFSLDDPAFDFSDLDRSIYNRDRRPGNSGIFKLLGGLIVIKNEDSATLSITLAHPSVKDYLLSPQFQQQFGATINLMKEVSHEFIAQTCVRYLRIFADANHSMTDDTLPDYPISLYAAKYWFHHLQLCDDRGQKALLPSTMHLLEDGSSQYAAFCQLWGRAASPLCMCSEMGYIEGVRYLLVEHNTSGDLATRYGGTALDIASEKGHLDIGMLLIEHKAAVNWANASIEGVKFLLKCGADVNAIGASLGQFQVSFILNWETDRHNNMPLHDVSAQGRTDVVQLLVESGADVNAISNNDRTALHQASINGHINVVKYLVKRGANINAIDKDRKTALHDASAEGHTDIVKFLVERGAYVNASRRHKTALHLASSNGHIEVVKFLVQRGANVNTPNSNGTALYLASSNGHIEVVKFLVESGATVNAIEADRNTALHAAAAKDHTDIVQFLLEHGANCEAIGKSLYRSQTHLNLYLEHRQQMAESPA